MASFNEVHWKKSKDRTRNSAPLALSLKNYTVSPSLFVLLVPQMGLVRELLVMQCNDSTTLPFTVVADNTAKRLSPSYHRVFSMIIRSEFRMGQYRDGHHLLQMICTAPVEFGPSDHREEAPHLIGLEKYQIDDNRFAVLPVTNSYISFTYAFSYQFGQFLMHVSLSKC